MKLLGYWTLFVALSISAVAAYYSIIGLAAIFAAALIPIIIMGSVLEIAKITTAVWLHANWEGSNKLIRAYLTSATIVLMLITSMGIFGFLSKAHIEQTAVGGEYQARIEQLEQKILTEDNSIERTNQQITSFENNTPSKIQSLQDQINIEQTRIDRIIERTQPLIAEQDEIISRSNERLQQRIQPLRDTVSQSLLEIDRLNSERKNLINNNNATTENSRIELQREEFATLRQKISSAQLLFSSARRQDIIQLQTILGEDTDGEIGPATTRTYNQYVSELSQQIDALEEQIKISQQEITSARKEVKSQITARLETIDNRISILNQKISETRVEIDRLLREPDQQSIDASEQISQIRSSSETEINNVNILIRQFRTQLAEIDKNSDQARVSELEIKIEESRNKIMDLKTEIFEIESSIRSLEAEVGPVKYIAQMIYGEDSDVNTLEKSVRIVILMLVFVFDPLAIVLVIAGISVIEKSVRKLPVTPPKKQRNTRRKKDIKKTIEVEEIANPVYKPDVPDENNIDISLSKGNKKPETPAPPDKPKNNIENIPNMVINKKD